MYKGSPGCFSFLGVVVVLQGPQSEATRFKCFFSNHSTQSWPGPMKTRATSNFNVATMDLDRLDLEQAWPRDQRTTAGLGIPMQCNGPMNPPFSLLS